MRFFTAFFTSRSSHIDSINPFANLAKNERLWRFLTIFMLVVSISSRIFQYIFHKDLWLDEAMLSATLYDIPFSDIFFAQLPYLQAAPLGFLAVSKAICAGFGYSPYSLYALPLVASIGTMILSFYIARILFAGGGGYNAFLICVFVSLCGSSLGLLHYANEFKQYGIEAFCAFCLVYVYLLGKHFRIFAFFCIIFLLFSNTIIFIAFGLGCGYLYKHRCNLLAFLRANLLYIALIIVCFAIYYVGYLSYQRVSGFYDYWAAFFLPHTLSAYPAFIKDIFIDVFIGFTPFVRSGATMIYMIISCFGFVWLFRVRRDMFVAVVVMIGVAIALSFFRIYPFGHTGIIGGRLSLYLSVIFYMLCAGGFAYMLGLSAKIAWKNLIALALLCLICASFVRQGYMCIKRTYYIQQTQELILDIARLRTNSDCVMIYHSARPAFHYYSFLHKLDMPYTSFDEDVSMKDFTAPPMLQCERVFILASHFPKDFESHLTHLLATLHYEVSAYKPKYNQGAFLLIAHSQNSEIKSQTQDNLTQ